MMPCADDTRQQETAETHAAHEDAEQDAERNRRRADRKLQQLEPHDFVYECGTPGPDKKDEQRRQPAPTRGWRRRQNLRIKLIHRAGEYIPPSRFRATAGKLVSPFAKTEPARRSAKREGGR